MTIPSSTPATRPRALRPGSRIALVAPAGPLAPDRIELSIQRCVSMELDPVLFPGARSRHRYLAGTDAQRLADLQAAFDDRTIDAVWALRGGYGSMRILDRLDLGRQREDPVPFIGFSDNTTLLARHALQDVIAFHGPHPGGDFPPETEQSFREVLFGGGAAGRLIVRPSDPLPCCLVEGRVEGRLIGGNLSMLAAMCGSTDVPNARGRILFLEEVGEAAYRIDRMLCQLERAGLMEGVLGLAFGRFTAAPDDDHVIMDTLAEFAQRLRVPAVADLPFGHVEHNCTLPVGTRAELDADSASLRLIEAAVDA